MNTANPFVGKASSGVGTGDYEIPKAGTHPARVVGLIDLGSHEEEYEGKAKMVRKCMVVYELVGQKKSGSTEPHTMAERYSMPVNEKIGDRNKLRKVMEAVRGRRYTNEDVIDITKFVGQAVQVTISHGTSTRGSDYARIDQVSGVMQGIQIPPPQLKPVVWWIGAGPIPGEHWIPFCYGEKIEEVIKRSKEWKESVQPTQTQLHSQPQPNRQAPQQNRQQQTPTPPTQAFDQSEPEYAGTGDADDYIPF